MEKNSIKVYARLRLSDQSRGDKIYEITRKTDYHELIFKEENTELAGYKGKTNRYRFQEVFDQTTSQSEVFQSVAKPIVNSLLNGYNGTIFAYGQTGSGKTYSIKGVPEACSAKGIIPRTIQHVFDHIKNSSTIYSVFISYMEIYNEIAYDLLSPTGGTGNLEELPRVTLQEDSDGNIHLKNLRVISVTTEREAMKFLYIGESNRKIAETPMNPRSSRSHCVFTVYISGYLDAEGIVRRSKLHLVDLAGSERIHKSSLTGTNLTEALHINLSLHFLEQVMLALLDTKRTHIPYRNSMMTTVLRDSLGGNCLTSMLATLTVNQVNILESITTCKFAQRVAMVKAEATISDEYDASQEIAALKIEIESLRKQLSMQRHNMQIEGELTKEEVQECEETLKTFLEGSEADVLISEDFRKMLIYFRILREMISTQQNKKMETQPALAWETTNLKDIIEQKDNEINKLRNIISNAKLSSESNYTTVSRKNTRTAKNNVEFEDIIQKPCIAELNKNNKELYKELESKSKIEMEMNVNHLKQKYAAAKMVANRIDTCKENIEILRKHFEENSSMEEKKKFESQLDVQQNIYNDSLVQLQKIKIETDKIKRNIEKAKIDLYKTNEQSSYDKLKNILGKEITNKYENNLKLNADSTLTDLNYPKKFIHNNIMDIPANFDQTFKKPEACHIPRNISIPENNFSELERFENIQTRYIDQDVEMYKEIFGGPNKIEGFYKNDLQNQSRYVPNTKIHPPGQGNIYNPYNETLNEYQQKQTYNPYDTSCERSLNHNPNTYTKYYQNMPIRNYERKIYEPNEKTSYNSYTSIPNEHNEQNYKLASEQMYQANKPNIYEPNCVPKVSYEQKRYEQIPNHPQVERDYYYKDDYQKKQLESFANRKYDSCDISERPYSSYKLQYQKESDLKNNTGISKYGQEIRENYQPPQINASITDRQTQSNAIPSDSCLNFRDRYNYIDPENKIPPEKYSGNSAISCNKFDEYYRNKQEKSCYQRMEKAINPSNYRNNLQTNLSSDITQCPVVGSGVVNSSTQSAQSKMVEKQDLDNIPLTGDPQIDEEIIAFYKAKNSLSTNVK